MTTMNADTKVALTVICCIAMAITAICVAVINNDNRKADVRKAEIEAGCKVPDGETIVRLVE